MTEELSKVVAKFNREWNVVGEKALIGLAKVTKKIGPGISDRLTSLAMQGYVKTYGYLFISLTNTDRVDDFIKFFIKKDGDLDKFSMNKSLEDFYSKSGDTPDFKIDSFHNISEFGYRYFDSEAVLNFAPFNGRTMLEFIGDTKVIKWKPDGKPQMQIAVEKHSTPEIAGDKLQVKMDGGTPQYTGNSLERWSDMKVRATVRNIDATENIYMSYKRVDRSKDPFDFDPVDVEPVLEPTVTANPLYGGGGDIQYEIWQDITVVRLEKWDGVKWVDIFNDL